MKCLIYRLKNNLENGLYRLPIFQAKNTLI
jgi:hypothetical protein